MPVVRDGGKRQALVASLCQPGACPVSILAIQHNNEAIADIAERFLTKGAKVYVEGQLQTRKWTDQGGQEHYTTEVVVPRFKGEMTMLSRANAEERPEADGTNGDGYLPRRGAGGGGPDDEIPFAPQML